MRSAYGLTKSPLSGPLPVLGITSFGSIGNPVKVALNAAKQRHYALQCRNRAKIGKRLMDRLKFRVRHHWPPLREASL